MMKKHDYKFIKEYVESFGYKLLSTEYKNANTKLKIECQEGHMFERTFSKFKQTQNCPYCTNTRKWNILEIKEYLKNIGYTLLSTEYKNNQTKLDMICSEGHKIQMTLGNIQQGKRCHICSRKTASEKRKHDYEFVKQYIKSEGYKLLSKTYINQDEKLKIRCPKGHVFLMSFCKFKQGQRCPQCCKNKKMSHKEFLEKFYNQNYNTENIEILSEYINAKTKIKCKCLKDGCIWYVIPNSLLNGTGCPQCNESKGEKRVAKYLDNRNIEYERQYKFNDCKSNKELPFDFYIHSLNIAIEYDGGQHYMIVNHFGGLNGFITTKIHDTIKTQYCKNNNIRLIRIPYWDFDNIENILSQLLNINMNK